MRKHVPKTIITVSFLHATVKGELGIRPASLNTFLTAYVYPLRQQQQQPIKKDYAQYLLVAIATE